MQNFWTWLELAWRWLVEHEEAREAVIFLLTVAAALGAAVWFLRQGRHLARINLSQTVAVFPASPDHWLLKVALTFENIGEIGFRVKKLGVTAQQVLPLSPGIQASLLKSRGIIDEIAVRDMGQPSVENVRGVEKALGAVDQRWLWVPVWLFQFLPQSWMVRRMRVGSWYDLASAEAESSRNWKVLLRPQEIDELWASLLVPRTDVDVVGVLSQVVRGKQGLERLFFWRPNLAWRVRTLVDLRKELAVTHERPERTTRVQEPHDRRAATFIPAGQQKPEPSTTVSPAGGATTGTEGGGGSGSDSGGSSG